MPWCLTFFGCHMSKNQPPSALISAAIRATFWRSFTASMMMSPMSLSPPLSIIFVATSREAMMLYWGEVEPCIIYDSFSSSRFSLTWLPSLACSMEAWEKAVKSLWVEWEQKMGGCSWFRSSSAMPK